METADGTGGLAEATPPPPGAPRQLQETLATARAPVAIPQEGSGEPDGVFWLGAKGQGIKKFSSSRALLPIAAAHLRRLPPPPPPPLL